MLPGNVNTKWKKKVDETLKIYKKRKNKRYRKYFAGLSSISHGNVFKKEKKM